MSMIQVGLIGIIGALLAVQFQGSKKEYAIYISVAIGLLIFFGIVGELKVILSTMQEIAKYVNLKSGYFSTLFKMLGITYVAEFASVICKDTGHQNLATQIEAFGKMTILVLSLPIMVALLKTIAEFLS